MAPTPPTPSTPTANRRSVVHWSPPRTSNRVSKHVRFGSQTITTPTSPSRLRGYRATPVEPPSILLKLVMERLNIPGGKCVSLTRPETRCTRQLGTRPNIPHLLSRLVLVMQQPQLDPDMVTHAYLMLLGVASCKDHALAHADRSWFVAQMLPDIWTIHNVLSSRRGDPHETPTSLLCPMEQPPTEPLHLKPIQTAMLDYWGQLAQIMSQSTSSRHPSFSLPVRVKPGAEYNVGAMDASASASSALALLPSAMPEESSPDDATCRHREMMSSTTGGHGDVGLDDADEMMWADALSSFLPGGDFGHEQDVQMQDDAGSMQLMRV